MPNQSAHLSELNKRVWVLIGSVLLTFFITYVDFLSGLEVHLTALLIIPVYFSSWYAGFLEGSLVSLLCALSLVIDPVLQRKIYPHLWEVIWNMVVLLVFFILLTYLFTRLKSELERAKKTARTDNLTGLLNTRAFFEVAEQERVQAIRYGHPLTLCFLDLDNFKEINDSLGHMTGDELLRIVAQTLRENIREADIAVRIGGDEFAILFPETGGAEVRSLVAKLHNALNQSIQQRGWTVTASIGLLTFNAVPGTVKDMLHHADQLMYRAKRGGKNQVKAESIGADPPG